MLDCILKSSHHLEWRLACTKIALRHSDAELIREENSWSFFAKGIKKSTSICRCSRSTFTWYILPLMPGGLKVSLGCLPCYSLTAIPIHRSALLANSYSALHWHFCSAPTAIMLPICSDMWYNNMGWCILVRFPYSDAKGGGSHGNGRCFNGETNRGTTSRVMNDGWRDG